jgi:hypothetical protein
MDTKLDKVALSDKTVERLKRLNFWFFKSEISFAALTAVTMIMVCLYKWTTLASHYEFNAGWSELFSITLWFVGVPLSGYILMLPFLPLYFQKRKEILRDDRYGTYIRCRKENPGIGLPSDVAKLVGMVVRFNYHERKGLSDDDCNTDMLSVAKSVESICIRKMIGEPGETHEGICIDLKDKRGWCDIVWEDQEDRWCLYLEGNVPSIEIHNLEFCR